ncbi:Crp/Fnr family transcriptional regulator [Pseudoflavitalea sp. X16]|uniref:Crp/Fnr family transcriptional regulator n=1 Tax=Paraflavitalea devenefica TaxID=2716334 RepID=UPI001424503D|nr:Crp/Fnr family transcriptional regulator [Paraflavitalea devenefica]NII26355.1 Crp/Fnr family transcriptional regulator [Paraflavitalea devenefica]
MYSRVANYIKQRIEISDEEIEEGLQYTTFKKYLKGEYILRIGEYCRFIGFINKGLIVTTTIDDNGKESAFDFKCENCFFTYTEELMNNALSHKNFIALEDCEALILPKENLEKILKLNLKFESLFTKILAEDLRNVLMNQQSVKELSAEERYLSLEKMYPGALQRIPVKYIAGYLGIEPESLSRLRRRLAGKQNNPG